MFANPRSRIPAPDQRTGSAPGATAPGKDPPREGTILGVVDPAHWKALGVAAVVYAAKGINQSII